MNSVIFYAPVGVGVQESELGGGEKGCRRTIEILEGSDVNVMVVDKPVKTKGKLRYLQMALKSYFRIVFMLVKYSKVPMYVVGFYEKNIFLETLILVTAKILGHSTIYELRNGRFVDAFYEYGKFYKWIIGIAVKVSDEIFCQGEVYVEFLEKVFLKKSHYTPNYVLNKYTIDQLNSREFDKIRLIYFGRVTESKNVELVLEVTSLLVRKKVDVHTTIIGGCSKKYNLELMRRIEMESLQGKVNLVGRKPFSWIVEELKESHFFVFPSNEKKEGHSNALTEAMAFGVVPIASNAGFSKLIVSKEELIINEYEAEKYAEAINNVLTNKKWQEYSEFMFERTKLLFTEDIVRDRIVSRVKLLLK